MSANEDPAALQAELAAARAEAAEAKAEAAHLKAEAAEARAAAQEAKSASTAKNSEPAQTQKASATSQPAKGAAAEAEAEPPQPAESELAKLIADGYAFAADLPALTLGTLLQDGVQVKGVNAELPLSIMNRHLLVAGATGTGKTRTLQLLAEGLSAAGSPAVLVDVKGDLTGLAEKGTASDKLAARTGANGQEWQGRAFPVQLLTPAGADAPVPGALVRTRVSDFGPLLLARALQLNTTQEQALQLIFSWADSNGLELVDLGDLRSVITFLTSKEGKVELATIGGVGPATAGVILRTLSALESQGGDKFFGEPSFDTGDLLRSESEAGVISLLEVGDMSSRPALISALIMWLLAQLFQTLPEVGDVDKPKLTFVFDEAHLLFTDATKEFVRQVVHTVRLIRSKGVSVIFVTQSPSDIPADVLAQLGSRIQHGLRAATPADQKALKETVKTFPQTKLDLAQVLTNLGTGEAVVTVLDPKGRPTPVAPFSMWAPASVMGQASAQTISALVAESELAKKYASAVDPHSATEELAERSSRAQAEARSRKEQEAAQKEADKAAKQAQKEAERAQREAEKAKARRAKDMESVFTNVLRSAGRTLGREITRSIFGTRRR
ncbi:ATPase [Actinomyces sp. HMSC064C12]|nr:ATPase [Actinomyces sp. HMSC064C12]